MSAKIFNPADFAPTSNEQSEEKDQTKTEEPKNYAVTGNSTRDSVRKLLYEIFSTDNASIQQIAAIVEEIENQISKDCPDPKSRQYRDMSRLIQTKLKGSRFQDTRNGLMNGDISVSDVCSEEFLSGKKQLTSKPASGPRSGITNANPIKQNFPKGAPGQAVRPRGIPTGQVFKAPGMRAPAPQRMPLVQQFQHVQNQHSEDQTSPSSELKVEQRASTQSQKSLVGQFEEQSKLIEDNQVVFTNELDQSQHRQTPQRIQEDISQQIEVPISFTQEEVKEMVPLQINTPHFQQNQEINNDLTQSFDASYDVSVDLSASNDTMRPTSDKNKNFPDQIAQSDENSIVVKKGVKAKKKKKKKIEHDADLYQTNISSNLVTIAEVQPELSDLHTKFDQQVVEEQKKPAEDEQKIELQPAVAPTFVEERQISPPKQLSREIPHVQVQNDQPIEQQIPKVQQRVQNVFLPPQNSNDLRMEQILAENLRLRQQIRQQAANEDSNLNLQHQIQLLQGQLKNREEQVSILRWQLQQQQVQHQTQIDEIRNRLKTVQQESQHFREQFSEGARLVQQTQQLLVSDSQRQQTLARNQQQSVQHLQIRSEEMTADRGSNFLGNSFQHAGNQVISGDVNDNNFESGEADEGGRDDGHFYRNTTADEGTGGAGESYQQRIIDGISSGSGQMPINSVAGYQRYEQIYGTGEDVQEIQNDDEEEDDDTYQTQYFGQNENNTQQNTIPQQQRTHNSKQSSSGSAFGEGNQQDDSEEGMGMGMGNRQGSGHDVEDESGSLDVVAQNSGQLTKIQQIFNQSYQQQQQRQQFTNDQTNNTNANNQGDSFEPQQEEIPEIDEDQNQSLGEEGGRSEGRDEIHDVLYNQLREFNQVDPEFQDQQFNEILPQHETNSQKNYDDNDDESASNQGSEDDSQYYEKNQQIGQNKLNNQTNSSLLNPTIFQTMDEEEEKGDYDLNRLSFLQKNQAVIGDNVERPQPYHPRQQQRNNQAPISTSGAAAFINLNQGPLQQNQQQQNTYMQGESIAGNFKQDRIPPVKQQQQQKSSIGGVAVATRQRVNIPLPQNSNKSSTVSLNNQIQAGERPGPPQRRGNKQQFQVPPLPQSSSTNQTNSSTRGQGQGGGVVGQNQSSSLTRAAGRNSRGTQRNNPQQQFVITSANQTQSSSQNQSEINLQSQSQSTRQPASQTSSAAQLPLFKQQLQSSIGGATGGIQNLRQQNASVLNEESQLNSNIIPISIGTGNNQTSGSLGAISQASTMPASQASASGSGNLRQQQHNGQGQTDRLHTQQNQQMQSAVTINHTQRQEGVVHTPGSQLQFGTYHGQSQPGAGNTQALGGAMMGSSGSIIGGDIGGLTERTTRGNNIVAQMNAESGSTTEFTSQRNNHSPFLSSNALLSTQAYQQVSSPPSNQTQVRGGQSHHYNNYQQYQSSQEIEGYPTSGGGDTEFFQAAVIAPPQTYTTRGAISSAQPGTNQIQSQQNRQKIHENTQQQSLFQGGNIQKGSGSGEAEQSYHHSNHQLQGVVSVNGIQSVHEQNFGQQYANHTEEDRSSSNQFEHTRRPQFQNRNYNNQIQSEWTRTDSRKTSGANTPSKDGADTPPYRDQVQNNSLVNPHILNLTSKRLQHLQNRSTLPTEIQDQLQRSNEPNNVRSSLEQQEEHKVIPKTMFE